MQDKLPTLYILCGLTNEGSEEFKAELSKVARENGYEAVCVSRYRKEGIRQYISEHPEFRTLVLQEAMQPSYPYMAEELSELMDHYHLNIVISIRKVHRGSEYMKTLYTAGILNALYEEDATAQNVLKRILYPRTHGDCRKYYQIKNARDAESALDIVNEGRMKQYITYIEEADNQEELVKRYRYVVNELKMVENIYLIHKLSSFALKSLEEDNYYQKIMGFGARNNRFKRLFCIGKVSAIFNRRKKVKETDEKSTPAPIREWTAKEQKRTDVEKMVDEDISDLLGFATTEKKKNIESEMLYDRKESKDKSVEVLDTKKTRKEVRGVSHWVDIIIGVMVSVILFAVLTLVLKFT